MDDMRAGLIQRLLDLAGLFLQQPIRYRWQDIADIQRLLAANAGRVDMQRVRD